MSAYVKGARGRGVRCVENVKVTGIRTANGAVAGVETEAGDIECEFVVCAAGLWSRHLGRLAGVPTPTMRGPGGTPCTRPSAPGG